jgi:hypothetical protein
MGYANVSKHRRSTAVTHDFQIFLGLCIAALAAAVVWLSVRDHPAATDNRVVALAHRVDGLERQIKGVSLSATTLAAQTAAQLQAQAIRLRAQATELGTQAAQLKRLSTQKPPLAARCLNEIQQEIDDIRGFIAYGGGIRRRVSADCTAVLKPRFGG